MRKREGAENAKHACLVLVLGIGKGEADCQDGLYRASHQSERQENVVRVLFLRATRRGLGACVLLEQAGPVPLCGSTSHAFLGR
jgi:hypothetical protein